jgi:3-dehydroquinate dehydratase-1
MIQPIKIKNIIIGEGPPKIIVPIVGKTQTEIVEKARSFGELAIDLVEWRVDFFEDALETEKVISALGALRSVLPEMPLLFTFRTKKEGGEKEISMTDYITLNKAVAETGMVDLVDVEIFSGDDVVRQNMANLHEAGVKVIASNHEFHKTPDRDELISRLCKMQDMGADILKVAVMPTSKADVLELLSATNTMYNEHATRPLVTMSMAATGVISRLAGEVFGSSMTFGAVGQVSAPGQIPVEQLKTVLDIIHNAL